MANLIKRVAAGLLQREERRSFHGVDLVNSEASLSNPPELCSCCGTPVTLTRIRDWIWIHNPRTCSLVNLALQQMGLSLSHQIRVEIYPFLGPLKGYYTLSDPYTIHISEDAYLLFPEYTIFHETKHLIDCLTRGWSEEESPDGWARSLCSRHGFRCPPPQQYVDSWYKTPSF